MWICMPTMMHPQSCKSSTKYTTTCLHSAEVETPPTSRQNYSYPGFLRRNLRELQTKGRHAVTGAFEWDALPPLLQVPAATGLLHLTLRGREVAFPRRDEQGRLWLEKPPGAEQEESRMDIAVHRRVTDDIPLLLTTRIDLQVSGESREALLGRALPDHFVPISLTGPLPARLEAD